MARSTGIQARSRATRSRILDAARDLLDSPTASASLEQVAAAAGVAKGTLFAHFGDRSALLVALRLADLEDRVASLRRRLEQADDPVSALPEALDPVLEVLRQAPEMARLLLLGAGSAPDDKPDLVPFGRVTDSLHDVIGSAVIASHHRGYLVAIESPTLGREAVMAFVTYCVALGLCHSEQSQTPLLRDLIHQWSRNG